MRNPTTAKKTAKNRLTHLRRKAALSQADLASDLGVTRGTVLRWECLTCEPAPSQRQPYARALGITVGELGRLIYEARS